MHSGVNVVISTFNDKMISYRWVKYLIVGSSGVLVNIFFLWLLTENFGIYYLLASPVAIEISVLNNFILNDHWTWGDRTKKGKWGYAGRLLKYNFSVSIAAIIGNILILAVLKELFGWNYLLANLTGIGVASIINYLVSDRWTFKEKMVNGGIENA